MNARDVVLVALFAAIMGVLGLVPKIDVGFVPVPITAQLLGVMLAGSILGAWRGALAMVLFLTLVAAGLPLLSGGRGGLGVFVGPSAGFLVGYVAGAYVTGLVAYEAWRAASWPRFLLANVLGGIVVVYAIGIPVLAQIAKLSLLQALTGSLIFIPGDLLKAILAASAAMFVRRGNPSLMTARPSYEG